MWESSSKTFPVHQARPEAEMFRVRAHKIHHYWKATRNICTSSASLCSPSGVNDNNSGPRGDYNSLATITSFRYSNQHLCLWSCNLYTILLRADFKGRRNDRKRRPRGVQMPPHNVSYSIIRDCIWILESTL